MQNKFLVKTKSEENRYIREDMAVFICFTEYLKSHKFTYFHIKLLLIGVKLA